MIDIVIVAVPYSYIEVPPLAPAVLKGALKRQGYSSKTIDLGMELFKECNDRELFDEVQQTFISPTTPSKFANEFINLWADKLANYPANYIGISVFSFYSHYFTYFLCQSIKKINPSKKIILGGSGSATPAVEIMQWHTTMTTVDKMLSFGDFLKKHKLCDYIILGDGELALANLLQTGTTGEREQIDFKQHSYYSDFDDYELSRYPGQLNRGLPQIPIFSSKGCVRNCDFCDVEVTQGKFRFKTGQSVLAEMLYLAERYGIRDFNFTDSLVNGSLKSFEEWVTLLAEYNELNPDKRITWNGSWICRPANQMKPYIYNLMAKSGCVSLTVGIESGSNEVLKKINKKTTVEALYTELGYFSSYNIKFIGLLIVAHWDETWDDFIKTCDLLYNLIPYAKSELLIGINLGITGIILDNTVADQTKNLHKKSPTIWWNPKNPALTAKERLFRLLIAVQLTRTFNIPLLENVYPVLYNTFAQIHNDVDEFYKSKNIVPENTAEFAYEHFDRFLEELVNRNLEESCQFELVLDTNIVSHSPKIDILVNGTILSSNTLTNGMQQFRNRIADLTPTKNRLTIKFYDKIDSDTVIENGAIINDTFSTIKVLSIDGIDLANDIEFYRKYVSYCEKGQMGPPKFGFWINNSELTIEFDIPFTLCYTKLSTKNVEYTSKMITTLASAAQPVDDTVNYEKLIYQLLKKLTV